MLDVVLDFPFISVSMYFKTSAECSHFGCSGMDLIAGFLCYLILSVTLVGAVGLRG